MRYDTRIYFQRLIPGKYHTDTGDYEDETVEETLRYASVTSSGKETLNLLYGDIKQDSRTIRLPGHYKEPFDRIRIDKKLYRADFTRELRAKQVFVVSEVQ